MISAPISRPTLLSSEQSSQRPITVQIAIVIAASLFVALCAHISVPLPFTPVPTTMQPFAVILVGMLLGPVSGFAAMTLYLIEGASGLPVFTPQGPGGVAQLLGPTAGYLFSYPFAAAIAGLLTSASRRVIAAFPSALLGGAFALIPVFSMGAFWLGHVLRLQPTAALHLAVTPFLFAEALKLFAAAAAYTALRSARRV